MVLRLRHPRAVMLVVIGNVSNATVTFNNRYFAVNFKWRLTGLDVERNVIERNCK
jgi:hypothetical protein